MKNNEFFKVSSSGNEQHQRGELVILDKKFIDHFYGINEFRRDSHNRDMVIIKYGGDTMKLNCSFKKFKAWYYK